MSEPVPIVRTDLPLCGAETFYGDAHLPISCGFKAGHAGPHAWESLPSLTGPRPEPHGNDLATLLEFVKGLGDPWDTGEGVNVCRYCQSAWRHADDCAWVALANYAGLET
jgi:hypothetical protein